MQVTPPHSKKCSYNDLMNGTDVYAWNEEASSTVTSPQKRPRKMRKKNIEDTTSLEVSTQNKIDKTKTMTCSELLSVVTAQSDEESSLDSGSDVERVEPIRSSKHELRSVKRVEPIRSSKHELRSVKTSLQLGSPQKNSTGIAKVYSTEASKLEGEVRSPEKIKCSKPALPARRTRQDLASEKTFSVAQKDEKTENRKENEQKGKLDGDMISNRTRSQKVKGTPVLSTSEEKRGNPKVTKDKMISGNNVAEDLHVESGTRKRTRSQKNMSPEKYSVRFAPERKSKSNDVSDKEKVTSMEGPPVNSGPQKLRTRYQKTSTTVAAPQNGGVSPRKDFGSKEEISTVAIVATPPRGKGRSRKEDSGSKEESAPTAVAASPRGRGRSRKEDSGSKEESAPTAVAAPPRGKGQSRKEDSGSKEESAATAVAAPPRGKGQSRKEDSGSKEESAATAVAAPPRGRGRSRKEDSGGKEESAPTAVATPTRGRRWPQKEDSGRKEESAPVAVATPPRRIGGSQKGKVEKSATSVRPQKGTLSDQGSGPQKRPRKLNCFEVSMRVYNFSDSEEVSSEEELDSSFDPQEGTGMSENSDETEALTPPSRIGIPFNAKRVERGSVLSEEKYGLPMRQDRSAKTEKPRKCGYTPKKKVKPPVSATSPVKRRRKGKTASESSDGEDATTTQRAKRSQKNMSFTIADKEVTSKKTRRGGGKVLTLGAAKERYLLVHLSRHL